MEIHLDNYLPEYPSFVSGIRRAPDRGYSLTPAQTETALMNALRYIPVELHEKLAPEFWRNYWPGDGSMVIVTVRRET